MTKQNLDLKFCMEKHLIYFKKQDKNLNKNKHFVILNKLEKK